MSKRTILLTTAEITALRQGTLTRLVRREVPAGAVGKKHPAGKPGRILRVQEAWRVLSWDPETSIIELGYENGGRRDIDLSLRGDGEGIFDQLAMESSDDFEAAGYEPDEDGWYHAPIGSPTRWRPAATMPRWAAQYELLLLSPEQRDRTAFSGEEITGCAGGLALIPPQETGPIWTSGVQIALYTK